MHMQSRKQKSFMAFALGAPMKYKGLTMDTAHRRLIKEFGMTDIHFDAVHGHLRATLEQIGVEASLLDDIMQSIEGMREQVLCRGKWAECN